MEALIVASIATRQVQGKTNLAEKYTNDFVYMNAFL
ncbi:hypothetical protein MARI_08090 [Marinobacter sp. JH2]|nr:hypothetical protein MARI_08090 [Marinobacter sp. JH2]